jgi:NAD(P)H dehydrogenase (quinone)
MTKGWIERVWNQGWANGWASLKHQKGLAIGVAADDAAIEMQVLKGVIK